MCSLQSIKLEIIKFLNRKNMTRIIGQYNYYHLLPQRQGLFTYFKGKNIETGEKVVLKRLNRNNQQFQAISTHIIKQIVSLQQIQCQNLPKYKKALKTKQYLYTIQQFIEGQSILQIDFDSFSMSQKINALCDLSILLKLLFDSKIVHCQVSPKNIFSLVNKFKLTNFQNSHTIPTNQLIQRLIVQPQITQFTAPQIKQSYIHALTDVYSFGNIFKFILNNNNFSKDLSTTKSSIKSCYQRQQKFKLMSIMDLIQSMLNLDPNRRPSPHQIVNCLTGIKQNRQTKMFYSFLNQPNQLKIKSKKVLNATSNNYIDFSFSKGQQNRKYSCQS